MIFLLKSRPIVSTIILAIICFALSFYFILQIFQGEFSILNLKDKKSNFHELILKYENNEIDLKESE